MGSALPESSLIRQEHIIRDMQLFSEVKLTRRGLVRYLALSLGLISPNESRTLMLDILEALFGAHFAGEEPNFHQIMDRVNAIRQSSDPAQEKAARYHIHQLKLRGIIERKQGKYRFVLPPLADNNDLGNALEYVYLQNAKTAFEKVKTAAATLRHMY